MRDWLYVVDHARAIDVIFHRGKTGDTYNIGGCNEWKNIEGSEFSENSQRMIDVTFNPVRGKQFRFLTNTTKRFRIVEIQLESPERKMNFENTKNGSVYAPGTVNDIFYAEDTGDCEVKLYIDSKELVYEKTEDDKYMLHYLQYFHPTAAQRLPALLNRRKVG